MQSLWEWPQKLAHLQMILVISSCFIINLTNGLILSFGNFLPYLISYMRVYSTPKGVRITYGTYIMAVQSVMYGCGIMIAGLIEKRLGPRLVTLLGAIVMCIGLLSTMFVIDISFFLVVVTYGLVGFGIGIVFVTTASCAMRWLPNKKGIASSFVCSGGGIGAIMFEVIQSSFVNSHNLKPDSSPYPENPSEQYYTQEQLLMKVRPTFLILFGLCTALCAIGSVFLNNPHPSYNLYPVHCSQGVFRTLLQKLKCIKRSENEEYELVPPSMKGRDEENKAERVTSQPSEVQVSPRQVIRRPSFYILWMKFFIIGVIMNFFVSLYKSFGLAFISEDDIFLTTVCNGAALSYILGRIVFGIIQDFTENEFTLVLESATMSFLLLTMYMTTQGGELMYFLWVCGVHFCIGGCYTLILSTVAVRYGEKHMVINFGLIHIADLPSQISVAFLTSVLVNKIDWWGTFLVIGIISFFDYIMVCFLHFIK